eukprot:CAMPEP_0179349506 /NCGR_PEP_ID=MMETSP0797-20121207/74270_1 /TAXON_ID=47934 /ORGANISM="Dinophysis acuminata, Strain DAEP01" /LENGTH=81 /DNA_ID=CAMNT_0021064379 /DNA_START=8 /DNA_END=249 /DNA_ORIENTATION=-
MIGLRRLSLKFPSGGEETGFLLHCNKTLRIVWPIIMSVYVLVFGSWALLVSGDVFTEAGPPQLISVIKFVPAVGGIILALV